MALLLTVVVGRMLLKCLFFLRRAILYCQERRVQRAVVPGRRWHGDSRGTWGPPGWSSEGLLIVRDHRSRISTAMDHRGGSPSITPLGAATTPPSISCPAPPWHPKKHLHGPGALLAVTPCHIPKAGGDTVWPGAWPGLAAGCPSPQRQRG